MIDNLIDIVSKSKINLNENDILEFLKNEKRWPPHYPNSQPSVEVITELNTKTMDFYKVKRDGTYLDYNNWFEYYNNGFTTIISNVLDLNSDLRSLRDKINNEIGLNICGNFYFSKPGRKASFNLHKHTYDVIAKQIYCESKWKIGDKEFLLEKNNTCFVPKNTEHAVLEKNVNKLSLTLNIE